MPFTHRLLIPAILLCANALISQAAEPLHSQGDMRVLEWTDLMPEEDLRLLEQMPEIDHSAPAPLAEDPLAQQIEDAIGKAMDRSWRDALTSSRIRPELDGSRIRIPGFVVPLQFDDDQVITEFFLVPYFGACIHVPPPPPNQIIHVTYPQGLQTDAIHTPFWVSGTLSTQSMQNELAHAAYSLQATQVELYQE